MTAWTGDIVEARFALAAVTLARSRATSGGPAAIKGMWPEVKQDARTAYGYTAIEAPRIQPTAAELSALDAVLGWVSRYLTVQACVAAGLASDAGWVAWTRSQGMSLPRIADQRARAWRGLKVPGGNSREAVRQVALAAYAHVARGLARDRVPIHVGDAAGPPEAVPIATGRHETMPRVMDTRRWVLNVRPCGECKHIATDAAGASRCQARGGAVSRGLRAQHPEGQPCFVEAVPEPATGG